MSEETPTVVVVDCSLLDRHGAPAVIERLMNDEELAQWHLDAASTVEQATLEEQATVVEPTIEEIAGALEKLPPDQPVTASDLLAILRPDTMTADAPASIPEPPAAGA